MRVTQAVILMLPGRFPRKTILGLGPLERTLLTASQAGVTDFVLVGRDDVDGAEILASLEKDKRFRSRNIQPDYIPLSGLAEFSRRGRIRQRFWLMEDRLVFSGEILDAALAAEPGTNGDVCVMNGAEFSGLALCSRRSFDRLTSVLTERGTPVLFENGTAENVLFPAPPTVFLEAGESFCESVKSGEAARRAGRYLIGTARKPTDGFFSRHFNRHVSTFLTRQLLRFNVTPMQISAVVLTVGLLSGWLEGLGGYRFAALGALLFEIASIIDGCDGENARLTFRISKLGGTFDITGDAATFVFFFLNVPIGLFRTTGNDAWLYLGALSFLSMLLFYLQMAKFTRRTGIGNNIVAIVKDIEKGVDRPGWAGKVDWIAAKIAPIYRRDFFATMAFLIIVCGGANLLMIAIAVMSPVETVFMYAYSRRRMREACAEIEA